MARPITFLRFRLETGWAYYLRNAEDVRRLGRAFQTNRLFGPDGGQYGFINCRFQNGVVLGYYAQEGGKEIINYDNEIHRHATTMNSFAHIMFALHLETGVVAIQKTRIVGFVDLNLQTMRTQFPKAIEQLMAEVGIPIIRLNLVQDKIEVTSEQLYTIFQNYKTTYLNVVNLKGREVPTYEEFKIFNPRVDEDRIFRQVFVEDTDNGLDSLTLQSPETDDLRNTALGRLSSKVGDVKSITVDPQNNGELVRLTTTVSDKFKVDVSSNNENDTPSETDIAAVLRPLTLTLTLSGTQGDVSALLNNLRLLSHFVVEGDDEDE